MMNLANTMMGHSMCMKGHLLDHGWRQVLRGNVSTKMCTSINFGGVLCRKNTILTRLRLSDSGQKIPILKSWK